MGEEKKLDIQTLAHKIFDIQSMLEVSINLQSSILAHLTNADEEEIKRKNF